MKNSHKKLHSIFLLLSLVFALAAIFQLLPRIRLESQEKAIAAVMLQDDIAALAESSDDSIDHWYQTLSDAGLSGVIVPAVQLNDSAVIDPIKASGLEIAQMGGDGSPGLYFAPLEYDIQLSHGVASEAEVASADSGRTWVMVENNPQTGCVIPDGLDVSDLEGPWAKGFYLRQNARARSVTTELADAAEVGDILFRAVADRGAQVLWIAPLGDENGIESDPQIYESLLERLQTRIERCGYHYGIPNGIEALNISLPVLILCGLGIFAAALLLLCLLFPIGNRIAWILYSVCALESVLFGIYKPQLQEILLSLGASIVFPSLSVYYLGKQLSEAVKSRHASLRLVISTTTVGAMITGLGCIYIGAVLGSWRYILVLQVFRGVKLSQAAVYLFAILVLGWMLLELRGDRKLKSLLPSINRKLMVRVMSVIVILVGIGTIYLMRTGDGMLNASALENRFRSALENLILYRPRTKEFLIAWPAIAVAFCFAARKDRLFTWLFGTLGAIGFPSIANTFCHIRAHFLVSVARTALGLVIGLLIGTVLFILFRPTKE